MARSQKISRWTWEELSGQDELKDHYLEKFRTTLLWILATPPFSSERQNAFKILLADEFSDEEGMSQEEQAAVYRLSEQISEELRPFVGVNYELSLQEWRLLFEAQFRDILSIPLFLGEMPEL